MTFEIAFVLAVLAVGFVLFVSERLPIEVTAFLVLAALLVGGAITVEEALSGFGNKAVITIGSLFVLSHALTETGLVAVAAEKLAAWAGKRYWLGVSMLLISAGVLSGFLNNTAIVAIMIPLVLDLCAKLRLSPSKVLIPLSYASIFGGTLTLIGTSTNLLVGSIAQQAGEEPFGMFEFFPVGAVFLTLGLVYTLTFGRRLLPARVEPGDSTEGYGLGAYLSEVRIGEDSQLVGRTLPEAELGSRFEINVLGVLRGERRISEKLDVLVLEIGDILIVQAQIDDLLRVREELGVELLADIVLSDRELAAEGLVTAEVLVAPDSQLVGKNLVQANFRSRFGGFVMAIRRHSLTVRDQVAKAVLQPWDALLTLIPKDRLEELRGSRGVFVLTELPVRFVRRRFWWLVLLILPTIVVLAAVGILEIVGGALLGAILLLALGVMSPRSAYDAINWQVIFLIAAFVPVGQAAIRSGAADFLAAGLVRAADLLPLSAPYAVLALLYLATSLLTQVVSNAAAAIVLAPVALSLASSLGVEPRAFLMAVCFAASAEFMSPVGYQTNLMVYAPGGYRFLDYTRFGAPLNLLFWVTAVFLIPWVWPF